MSRGGWKIGWLIAAAAAVYLVGNGRTQLFDRDEPRYAQCSRQMLQSGDWVVPRLYDKIRAAKPPGIYWCQAASMELFGDNAFAARLPSTLAAVLTLALLGVTIWRDAGPRHAFWTVFVFSSSLLTIWSAKVAMTDSVLLLWTTIALLCVYLLWRGRGGWPAVIMLSVCIGFAGLVKGPFILGVLGGTIGMLALFAAFDRLFTRRPSQTGEALEAQIVESGERGFAPVLTHAAPVRTVERTPTRTRGMLLPAATRSLVGLLIVACIVVPWLVLVTHREPSFLKASTQDAMQHLETGAEGHKGPPGYHLALIWFTFLPWSILLPLAIGSGIRNRSRPQVRFALAAVLGTWVFVEVLQTKLPHYILPAFPALAFLTADAVIRCIDREVLELESRPLRIASLFWGLAVLALATGPWWFLAIRFHDFPWIALVSLTIFGLAYGFGVCALFLASRPRGAIIAMGAGALVLAALLFGLYFPQSRPLRLSSEVARVLKEHDVVHPNQSLMLDYKEPSLAFYQGGTIREAKHSLDTIQHIETAPPWMVITRKIWDKTPDDVRARLERVGPEFEGCDYSESVTEKARLMVVRKR